MDVLTTAEAPKDARIVALILKSMGIDEFDPRVIHQLLEFMHQYTTNVFQDAQLYADHAAKPAIDLEVSLHHYITCARVIPWTEHAVVVCVLSLSGRAASHSIARELLVHTATASRAAARTGTEEEQPTVADHSRQAWRLAARG